MTEQARHRPLGLLRPGVNPDVVMMLCTAGHVDHGKTRLVKLLTGCNTDRLKEEQERGLTIELGFAPCFLGGNLCVGIVDVPGHEKFIKNMVAGVSGIDMTVLVVAADDGVMPQTIEHVQIMELLGVRRGLVALTKTDLVTSDRLDRVKAEIAGFLQGTFLESAPICPVSSETLEGYFEFYDELVKCIAVAEKKRRFGVFRMPIERVFVRPGHGTVVTGIPVDGTVSVGMALEVVPGGRPGKVRSMQRFLRGADEGGYGQCLALNIPDAGKTPPERGQVLCVPGYLKASTIFHARIRAVPGLERPLRNAEEVKVHVGTAEEPAKVYLLEGSVLTEGQAGFATVVMQNPVAAAARDRLILRRASPAATVAGGEIWQVDAPGERARKKQILDRLKAQAAFFEGLDPDSDAGHDRAVEWFLITDRPQGASPADISRGTMLAPDTAAACLARLAAREAVSGLAPGEYIHADAYRACVAEAEARLRRAGEKPDALSVSVAEVRNGLGWPAALWDRVQRELEQKGVIRAQGSRIVLESSVAALPPADRELMERIRMLYEETGFHSPRPEDLPDLLNAPAQKTDRLLNHLCNNRQLYRIAKNVVLSYTAIKKAQEIVVGEIAGKGALDSADFKYAIDSSRKYALAILDFLDARRVTVRSDNLRKLASSYERNLIP